jgi:uncharacterized protein (TIGR00730 family)
MKTIDAIAIFCGSSAGNDPRFEHAARATARMLASRGITIVYGGGRLGLMGIIADEALAHGGKVIGVIPHAMVQAERAHTGLTEMHMVTTMHERKAKMASLSQAAIALPGGHGTLDELFEWITWTQLAIHLHPIGLLNVAGFYDHLAAFLDQTMHAGFIHPRFRSIAQMHDDPEALLGMLQTWTPPGGAGWSRPIDARA